MDFQLSAVSASNLSRQEGDALLVILTATGQSASKAGDAKPAPNPPVKVGDKALAKVLIQALDSGEFELKPGKTWLHLSSTAGTPSRWLFSVAADGSASATLKAVAAGVALIRSGPTRHLLVAFADPAVAAREQAQAVARGVLEATYSYRETKPSAAPATSLVRVTLLSQAELRADLQAGLDEGAAMGEGTRLARELANRPANLCTPTHLAEQAKDLGKRHGLKVQVLEATDARKLGMGAFLAVAQGSDQPPKMIVAQWQGGARKAAPIVLIGKGITFDTGGISIKPAAEMDEMKFDMAGAASVLGTLEALARMKAPVNVVGIVMASENMPSGRAVKPGDVVTSMSGQTIEILNTDAEGRLVLCDALTYAERFKPACVVDIATLTGACVIALGHQRTGLFANDDALAQSLAAAGDRTGDSCWRMPLDDAYDEGLKSNFADVANVGPRAGGSITAAKFLQRFAGAYPWAHLDIAGTAWKSGAQKGATGRPVPLLTQFVLDRAVGSPGA